MDKTKRAFVGGLLAAAMTAGIAAPSSAQQRTEIQFWHAMGGVLGERVDEIVKRYNASQTKYTVVATNKGNYDEVINGTIAAYRAKKAPHIVQIYERGFMTMLLSDAIVPVQDLLTEKKKQIDWGDFIKPVASYYQYKGKLMTMPFNSSAPILWYNKEHFEKAGFSAPGPTWQELDKQLYAIKSKGIAECGSSLAGDFFWSLIENYSTVNDQPFGTKANGYDGLDTVFVYNKTKVVDQTKRLKKWIDDGDHADRRPGPHHPSSSTPRASARPSSPRRPRTAASSATPRSSGAPPTCPGKKAPRRATAASAAPPSG